MTFTNNSTFMPHRPSRGAISRVALLAAYSRAGKRKHATADASLLTLSRFPSSTLPRPNFNTSSAGPSSRTDRFARPASHLAADSVRPSSVTSLNTSKSVFKPRKPVYLATFNVRSLKQAGQQVALARTLDSLSIDVCCLSETRTQDASTVIELTAPSLSSRFRLRTSGDAEAAAAGYAGVGIVLSERAEASLLDWIPVDSRLCAVRLATSVRESRGSEVHRTLFIVSAYAPTDCSSESAKDSFYDALGALLQQVKTSDIVVVAGDMNAQVGRLSAAEARLGGRLGLDTRRTDNGDRLLQMCADHRLFLCSTNFRNSGNRLTTWCPPTNQRRTQIDHIAVSYRWRGSITACRSFWNTSVDSDHALVRCCFSLRFSGVRKTRTPRLAIEKLVDPEVKRNYQNQLVECLPDGTVSDINGHWEKISKALLKVGTSVCGTTQPTSFKHWISDRTVSLLETRRQIPPGRHHNSTRRIIRRQVKLSVRADREAWWTRKAEEMEDAKNAGNVRRLFHLIRSTGPRKPLVSETIRDQNGSLICNKAERLDRWAQYFEQQFSWPPATSNPESWPSTESWTVNMESPSVSEVSECISLLKRHRAAGPDDLPPALFKDGGGLLSQCLSRLFGSIWEKETVPDNWGESIVVPIFKKGTRSECSNHRGVSLTPVVTRLLASLILRRLTMARETLTRENQAGFRPGRGCIDHIFTLRQVLEQRHMYRRPTILVFLDFKGAFDSVDRSVLLNILAQQGMPQKFVNIIRSLYSHTSGRVRVYGELSKSFPTKSGVRQGCPLSPFLFNFVIDEIMRRTLEGLQNPGVQIVAGESLVDLEYADDIALIFEDQSEAQALLNRLTTIIPSFGMRLAPSKCKVMLQNVQSPDISLKIQGESLEIVENFTYLGSCISSDGSVSDEVSARISKARITFANLRHLWRQKGISLDLKGRVYQATVRAVLLYGCETWPLRTDDVRRLQVFDHRCLRSVAGFGWRQRVSHEVIRKRVFGCAAGTSIGEIIQHHRLRWLGHVLRMPKHRLPRRVLFSVPPSDWRKPRGGQRMTWQKGVKEITKSLGVVGAVRLPGWGPRDPACAWLETLQEMAANRCQWRSCCQFLSRLSD